MGATIAGKWPKTLPPLTPEQQQRSDEFMKLWHVELARRPRYGLIEHFNHTFPVKHSPATFTTTLEIGAGLGEHLHYEHLTPLQERGYHCVELRENMAAELRHRFPRVQTIVGDCQQRLDFPDASFDRIIAVHVLEHLPNLPACLRECHRLLRPVTFQCWAIAIPLGPARPSRCGHRVLHATPLAPSQIGRIRGSHSTQPHPEPCEPIASVTHLPPMAL